MVPLEREVLKWISATVHLPSQGIAQTYVSENLIPVTVSRRDSGQFEYQGLSGAAIDRSPPQLSAVKV